MEPFYIYLTFDIDQDFNPNSPDYYNRSAGLFNAFETGFGELIDKLRGRAFSVFIRSDYQIKCIYGEYDYLLKHNPTLTNYIKNNNGEINWHIHLYEQENEKWVPVKEENLAKSFYRDFLEVKKIGLINSEIVRIGECVMTNLLMKQIAECGIKIDSTALPNRKRNDQEKHLDWSITSNKLYQPSTDDYRICGTPHYDLIEVPMTTIKMKTSYDKVPIPRYFNLSFKTDVLFQNFPQFVDDNNSIITITHPFEVIANGNHGLIAYSKDVFTENLCKLEQIILSRGKVPVYKHISEINTL